MSEKIAALKVKIDKGEKLLAALRKDAEKETDATAKERLEGQIVVVEDSVDTFKAQVAALEKELADAASQEKRRRAFRW